MQTKTLLCSLVAALVAAVPHTGYSRDHDHHDHHDNDHHDHGHYYGYRNYGYGNYYGRGGYYGSYYSPYYYNRPYWGPSLGLSFYSSPSYVYRGYVADDRGYSLAAEVQSVLRRRGYYHGAIDGSIGYGSRAAIRAYQANHGLYVTGRIDRPLLRALGIG